jgi:hypothetical protein
MKMTAQNSIQFYNKKFLLCAFLLFWSGHLLAANVATVIILKGKVKAKLTDGSILDVKENTALPEGAVVQTAEKSFVKLLFVDKSQMNLGPNSQMVINSFPKNEAGIITLVKGQLRSKVTKDYMEMDDKSKSKLYIKTKTAAMGVRGTDFQVNFNPINQNTALITFEGRVAMSNIDREIAHENFDQNRLERTINSDKAVMVTKGEISAVNLNVSERAMLPTKLGTKQIEALESNESGVQNSDSSEKQFRNPIPPGAEGTQFSNTPMALEKEISKLGVNVQEALPKVLETVPTKVQSPEGFFNTTTGEYKLPAGSVVDLNTVNIVPPPTDSVFDKNTGTYIVPESLGQIDKKTGEYKAPAGLELAPDGKFQMVNPELYMKSLLGPVEDKPKDEKPKDETQKDSQQNGQANTQTSGASGDGRSPASVGPATTGMPITAPMPPQLFTGAAATFVSTFANPVFVSKTQPPPPQNDPNRNQLTNLAGQVLNENNLAKEAATNTGTNVVPNNSTRTKFTIDVQ